MPDVAPVRRALISVSDKSGLIDFARALSGLGVALVASGGTRRALREAGVEAAEVADLTGQAEILGGRVKTLHPTIHAGILARRDEPGDVETLRLAGIEPIDLVVVNLYPFEDTVARPGVTLAEAIEQVDIGGPSLIRGAAKNERSVAVATSPDQYPAILDEVRSLGGTTQALRSRLMRAAFRMTSAYDAAIADYMDRSAEPAAASPPDAFPDRLSLSFRRRSPLRYGENPHQSAAFYVEEPAHGAVLANAEILHGKELSYNNLLDLDAALRLLKSFAECAAVVLKHNNPCGAALAPEPADAFELAYEGDPLSAFGGIVGLNRPVDEAAARRMAEPGRFLEAVIAPSFTPDALRLLTTVPTWKASVRLLATNRPIGPGAPPPGLDLRRVEGGLLAQDWDAVEPDPTAREAVTRRPPTDDERRSLDFAWRVGQAVKSNAIVLARGTQVVGVGAGQMSRLDSVRIAALKAGDRSIGSVLASDAFFPFRDGPDSAARAGVTAILQPGGSRRDADSIAACDEAGIAMIFTGRRHFRH